MPHEGRKPLTVYETTHRAVKELRDSDEEYGSYDEALQDLLLQANRRFDFMEDETADALEAGRKSFEEVDIDGAA